MKKKILQVPVIVGKGSEQFFVEKDVAISPSSPPIYKIEKIDKKVVVTDAHVIPGKVIFNAFIWKNVTYKTVEDVCDGIVSGKLNHITFKIPFGGFVEIKPIGCDKIKEGDVAELLEAFVEGEKDFLHDETTCKGQKVFCSLLEKDVVKLTFKVVRFEHVPVCAEEDKYDDDKKDKEKCKCDKYDDDKKDDKCDEKDDKWDKRYDCRGDYYAKCRGSYSQKY
ncbi:MAG: DUF3794 domain-containing protein [Acetivibrionales bacterium]|jgi:hypothetical protein|nr:DUF3794 domain-containing protein [Clostridiaceae bacterium]